MLRAPSSNTAGNTTNRNNNNRAQTNSNANDGKRKPDGFDPVAQAFRARELAETEAKIKASETGSVLIGVQAKLQFQKIGDFEAAVDSLKAKGLGPKT